ncbi:putative disease resistance RPP13-like protein 3 isoform X2 [Salvia hispanica]|uniref:putative disease resistance RPP13-like protein 3 isoform X2 n=1 Tax=Salvia hispanica TaxID=49212 RepID=UPI0020091241|nr:putative disease resistance RPP13-like protein 3 isoform X2 [Salvia hispanica]
MAEAAVSFLLQQLEEVAFGYADAGAEREFDQLKHDLDFIKAFLRDIAKKKKMNQVLKLLERRIMDVVYEVEETIDTCLTKAMEFKATNFIRRRIKRISIANAVKAVREQKVLPLYEDIRNSANAMIIADGAMGTETSETDTPIGLVCNIQQDTPIGQNRVIGFDDDEDKITAYLSETRERLGVIAIVGIPGQGKTTLAWNIYQSNSICFAFPNRIWVHMPREFNERDVFLQILKKFMPSKAISSLNFDELANTVCKCLEKEKFLLVLDDVWSVAAWEKIEAILPLDKGFGKVLITTQEKNIGERCIKGANGTLHNLRFLSIDKSWELLQYEVFGDLNSCPKNLEGFVREIASKCDGVPLMITVIGRVLKDQLMKSRLNLAHELKTMSQSVSEALQNRVTRIAEVVGLSYHRLPNDLRGCFIFLGVFPEDYEIPAKMLCELWISEGFVLPRQGRSIEESAEENMNDLIRRNLLEDVKTNHMGKVKACRVNAMIRAFCISIIKEENLCEEVRQSLETGELETSGSQLQKSHRLCFRSDPSNFLSKSPPGPHVRSLLCFNERPAKLKSEFLAVIPERFKKLRVLESKCIELEQFPWKIVKLVHLRYLTLYIETLETLPEPFTQLWNLQSLVIKTKSRSIIMKANLWRMMRLRYLNTRAAILLESTKSDGEAGHNLHTLNRLAPESCTDAICTKAVNLNTLGIYGKLASIFQKKFLEKLHHLENLKLYEQPSEDMLPGLPLRNCFPPTLKRLTLMNTSLEWTHMSTLAMIKTLEVLKLKENAFVGPYWAVTDYSFSNLYFLLIANADLVIWEVSYESFPELSFLVLKKCENLVEIPEALAKTLEKLEVERLQESAVASVRKIIEEKKYHFEKRSLQLHDWESPISDTRIGQKLEVERLQESAVASARKITEEKKYHVQKRPLPVHDWESPISDPIFGQWKRLM